MPAASVEENDAENESSGEARRGEARRRVERRGEWWGARLQRRVVGVAGEEWGKATAEGARKWNAESQENVARALPPPPLPTLWRGGGGRGRGGQAERTSGGERAWSEGRVCAWSEFSVPSPVAEPVSRSIGVPAASRRPFSMKPTTVPAAAAAPVVLYNATTTLVVHTDQRS